MPELGTVALVSVAVVAIVFALAWICLLNRRHRHVQLHDVSQLISDKMWIGPNPLDVAAAELERDRMRRRERQLEEAKKREELLKEKNRAFVRIVTSYCRSLRSEREITNVYSFMGWREDKFYCTVNDNIINRTFVQYASDKSLHPRVTALMTAVRLQRPISESERKIALSDPSSSSSSSSALSPTFPLPAGGFMSPGGSSGLPSHPLGRPVNPYVFMEGTPTPSVTAAGRSDEIAAANALAAAVSLNTEADVSSSSSSAGPLPLRAFTPTFDYLSDKQQRIVRSILMSIKHPYIMPILDVGFTFDKSAVMVCRPLSKDGSLRDLLWDVDDPTQAAAVKYPEASSEEKRDDDHLAVKPTPLKLKTIAKYGRHVLEALAYLDRACLPFYHLHAGNVILVNGRATLTDIESLLIGLPPRHLKKLQRAGPHDPVVVAFCCLIYELATGNSLAIPTFPRFPSLETLSGDYDDIADVLKFVFSPRVPIELDKDGKPKLSPPPPYVTVHDLLKLPFFKSVPGVEECPELPAPGQTKQPSQMREAMSVPAASANYDSLDVLYDPRVKQLAEVVCSKVSPTLPQCAHTLQERFGGISSTRPVGARASGAGPGTVATAEEQVYPAGSFDDDETLGKDEAKRPVGTGPRKKRKKQKEERLPFPLGEPDNAPRRERERGKDRESRPSGTSARTPSAGPASSSTTTTASSASPRYYDDDDDDEEFAGFDDPKASSKGRHW